MEPHGYIRSSLDIKLLILYVLSAVGEPIEKDTLFDLCYRDDSLSYFDFEQNFPQLLESGHVCDAGRMLYAVTEKGRAQYEALQDRLASPVRTAAKEAVLKYQSEQRKKSRLQAAVLPGSDGLFTAKLRYGDGIGPKMELSLPRLSEKDAELMAEGFRQDPDYIYNLLCASLLSAGK